MVTKGLKRTIISSAIAAVVILGGSTAQALTLKQVTDNVLDSHPDIHSARSLFEASSARVNQARSQYLPKIGLSYEYSDSEGEQSGALIERETRRTDATLSWRIFEGFATSYAVSASKNERHAARAQLEATREAVALEVTEVYLALLRAHYLYERSNRHVQGLAELVSKIEARAQFGRLSQAQTAQAKSRLIQAQADHSALRGELRGLKHHFKLLTSHAPANLQYPAFDVGVSQTALNSLIQRALIKNPEYRAADAEIDAKQADLGAARARLFPTVSLEMSQQLNADIEPQSLYNEDNRSALMVELELPIGNGALSKASEAAKLKQAAVGSKNRMALDIKSTLGSLQQELLEEIAITSSLKENIAATRQVVSAYTLQFEAGRRSLLDLLTAWSDRYKAQSALINNWYQKSRATAEIYALLGQLRGEIEKSG